MNQGAPLIVLGVAVAVLLGVVAVRRSAGVAAVVCCGGLMAALCVIPTAARAVAVWEGVFDFGGGTEGFMAVIIGVGLLVAVIGAGYWRGAAGVLVEEFFLLLLMAVLGACALVAAENFCALFLGLETMTLGMIGMIAYARGRADAAEAGLKYLVLSGMSSGFLLFGMGLLALATGRLDLGVALTGGGPMVAAGMALMGIAVGFKLSVVPFHIWVPDVYAGAPAPSGAFLAVVPKVAVLGVLLRVVAMKGVVMGAGVMPVVTAIAVLSMLAGNLLALQQQNVKRVLGYSSIAHLGYLLVAIVAAGALGRVAVVFYMVTYGLTMVGAFGVLAVLSDAGAARDVDRIEDLRGLFWRRPALAGVMTLALLSLAGIPPAIGFIAKMYVFAAGVHTDLWVLVGVMIGSSVIGLFYYLSIIIAMTERGGEVLAVGGGVRKGTPPYLVLGVISAAVVGFGVAPQPLISFVRVVFG